MKAIKTTLDDISYDLLDLEAGRQGISQAEALRHALILWLSTCNAKRRSASMLGENPYKLEQTTKEPIDTGAW